MVRQTHHERNQPLTVRPEPFVHAQESLVEGLNQSFLKQKSDPDGYGIDSITSSISLSHYIFLNHGFRLSVFFATPE